MHVSEITKKLIYDNKAKLSVSLQKRLLNSMKYKFWAKEVIELLIPKDMIILWQFIFPNKDFASLKKLEHSFYLFFYLDFHESKRMKIKFEQIYKLTHVKVIIFYFNLYHLWNSLLKKKVFPFTLTLKKGLKKISI